MCPGYAAAAVCLVLLGVWGCCSACPAGCTCTVLKGRGSDQPLRSRSLLPLPSLDVTPTTSVGSGDGDALVLPPPLHTATASGKKVVCNGLTSLNQLSMENVPLDTIHLDLSNGQLTRIHHGAFSSLTSLEKLELQNNQISELEAGAFVGLGNLLRLNLSGNRLGSINASTLVGMPRLTRLSMSGNDLKGMDEKTFDDLPELERIDFASVYLVCDCHLAWIFKWQKLNKVRIHESTTCAIPSDLKGRPVKALKRKDMHCDWEIELPLFNLSPSSSQIVFQGDRLPFECRASVIDDSMQMSWVRGDAAVLTNRSLGISVEKKRLPDRTLVSTLLLERLSPDQSGVWRCLIQTPRGNSSKSVSIIVLSNDTPFCPPMATTGNKGQYVWPKTVAGVTQDLACSAGPALNYEGEGPARAYHRCDSQGVWGELDTARCQFSSERTRSLERLSQVGFGGNVSRVLNRAASLEAFFAGDAAITDSIDVIFTSRIVQTFSQQISAYDKLADIILHVVSTIMNVDDRILLEAEQIDRACSRMLSAMDDMVEQLLLSRTSAHHYAKNIALEAHRVDRAAFNGITCSAWLNEDGRVYQQNAFQCSQPADNETLAPVYKPVEASIHIPAEIFRSVRCLYPSCDQDGFFNLHFIVYKNAKLFPRPEIVFRTSNEPNIASSVISSKIGGVKVENTTHPVEIRLHVSSTGLQQRGVFWDTYADGGLGDWSSRGCQLIWDEEDAGEEEEEEVEGGEGGRTMKIHCNHLTSFAFIQSSVPSPSAFESWLNECFNMSPAIYAGSLVLVFCTMAVSITYISAHRQLRMPRKAKHCVGNLSVAVLLLCVTYTLGIRTQRPRISCQIIGLAVHYLSLCALFWLLVLAFVLCKKWNKAVCPPPPPTEPLEMGGPPVPRSPLTCYLLGWGVPLIVCGISGAIHWRNYGADQPFCFLSFDAALLTFFLPAGILVLLNIIFFLRMLCILRSAAGKRRLVSDVLDDPETEEVAVHEMSTTDFISSTGLSSSAAHSSSTVDAAQLDTEYTAATQLRGLLVLLLLYLITWTNAAIAVALPFEGSIPHQEIIFNYLYAFSAAALAIFMLVFFCLGRSDARSCWRQCCCCEPSHDDDDDDEEEEEEESEEEDESRCNGGLLIHPVVQNGSLLRNGSLDNSSSYTSASYRQKLPSHTPSQTSDPSIFSSGVNLYPNFYNPRQNGVARKYWEKHNQRKRLTQLNRDLQQQDSEFSSMDEGIFKQLQQQDSDTHLSIEIQIQPKKPTEQSTPLISGLTPYMPNRNDLCPVGGPSSACTEETVSPPVVLATFDGPFHSIPGASLSSYGAPKPHQEEFMQRPGASVPRLRDFDGESATSAEPTGKVADVEGFLGQLEMRIPGSRHSAASSGDSTRKKKKRHRKHKRESSQSTGEEMHSLPCNGAPNAEGEGQDEVEEEEEEGGSVWVPQTEEVREEFKKETSV
ncbi:hypothetical protein CAPTEDRAFT_219588 [Capitella teleta]|uniref:G-protein coupled receptors family 2 profile 2 domain-containing protein n=1 Tax=Capitella teleta TaxID=283909 RepID=R7UCN0_CAPTE|nr:hypothetical protein CAPTEDRAFT_219588 [Capitella teleta]|eukprot:ELU04140.1 hypothetical protein CAPTEDRAFT_219588 [Capitella teleta]